MSAARVAFGNRGHRPSRAKAEGLGRGDLSPMWAGQNTSGCRETPADELTHELAHGLGRREETGR